MKVIEFCHTDVHQGAHFVDMCMYCDVEESMQCNQGGSGEVSIPHDSSRPRFKHFTVGISCCFVGGTHLCEVSSGLNPVEQDVRSPHSSCSHGHRFGTIPIAHLESVATRHAHQVHPVRSGMLLRRCDGRAFASV